MDISQINPWAVLGAAVAKFMVGGLWFAPFLFGKTWIQEAGLKMEELASPVKPMILSAVLGLVTAFTLAVVIMLAGLGFMQTLALAVLLGIGIVAAMLAPEFSFEGRSFRLYAIYAGQHVVELILMAAIIGAWQ